MNLLALLGFWTVSSLPISLLLGSLLADRRARLIGLDGVDAIYERSDGTMVRVPLLDTSPAMR